MPFFEGVSGQVYYRQWPCEAPVAVLAFLHGFGEHTGLYHRYAAELGVHGVELWALDEIGHGLSEGERGNVGSVDALVENARRLVSLAERNRPGLPVVLAGHSLGSAAAAVLATAEPGRFAGLVVSGALLSPAAWLLEPSTAGTDLDLDPASLSADPFYLDSLANDPLAFTSGNAVEVLTAALVPAWDRLDTELERLPLPVLAVHGAKDEIAPLDGVQVWQSRLADLRVEIVDDAAHDVLNEVQHRQVADIVAGFVLDVAGESAPGRS